MTKYEQIQKLFKEMGKRESQYKKNSIVCIERFCKEFAIYLESDIKNIRPFPSSKKSEINCNKRFSPFKACEYSKDLFCYQFGVMIKIDQYTSITISPIFIERSTNGIRLAIHDFTSKYFKMDSISRKSFLPTFEYIVELIEDRLKGNADKKTIGFYPNK